MCKDVFKEICEDVVVGKLVGVVLGFDVVVIFCSNLIILVILFR